MKRFLFASWLCLSVPVSADTIYLYDRSGSMDESMDSLRKIEIARDAFNSAMRRMPDKLSVGFASFPADGGCGVTDSIDLRPAAGVRASLEKAVNSIEPAGSTPLALAIDSAGKMFTKNKEINRIIIITDGIETCGGDPEAMARKWHNAGLNIVVHIISFAMGDVEQKRLEAVARAGGGAYINVVKREDALWGMTGLARLTSRGTCEEIRTGPWTLTAGGYARSASGQQWSLCAAGQKFEMCACRGAPALYTKQQASSLCPGGRLPSIEDLEGLIHQRKSRPFLDTSVFSSAAPHRYWSSSVFGDDQRSVYDFSLGQSETIDAGNALVRCLK